MATWSADAKEVAPEVRAALTAGPPLPEGPADAYVHIRSGLDSLLGDTHLILSAGRLRIVSRGTSLDPLAEAVLTGRPTLDDSGYRNILEVPTAAGVKRLEVTALEEDAVEDLLEALPEDATPRLPERLPEPPRGPEPGGFDVHGVAPAGLPDDADDGAADHADVADDASPSGSLDEARAALIGTLARRAKQRRSELLARRGMRRIANVDVKLGHRRSPEERWRHRHRPRKSPQTALVERPAPRTPSGSLLRLMLVVVAGLAIFAVFATLGRLVAGAR